MNPKSITGPLIILLFFFKIGQPNAQTNHNASVNSYSFDLYREAKIENENLFLSPLSTYYALLVAYEGSKNNTRQDFEKVLYLNSSGSIKNEDLYNLARKMHRDTNFKVSNAIWVDNDLQIKRAYKKSVSDKYFSDFMQTEFTNVESAVVDINSWVSKKTNRRINEIVNTANINSDTKFMISNAVYFKGEWLNKFEKQRTISAPFFTSDESQYKVDFMNMTESLQYFENDRYQFVSKPYRDTDLSFCIVLPKKLFGIEEIEKEMDNEFFRGILDSAYATNVSLAMPKLRLESSYLLNNALINSSLKSAFTNEADFSGITKKEPLWLGQVLHKTWMELDEETTEAAAATATIMITGRPSYKIFKADHPFIFFIIDNSSKAIVFMGRYVKPIQGEAIEKENLKNNLEKRRKGKFELGDKRNDVLIILDDEIVSQAEIQALKPEDIKSFKIYKDEEDLVKFSSRTSESYDGVIVITLKKK